MWLHCAERAKNVSLFVRFGWNCFLGLYLVWKNTTSSPELMWLHCAERVKNVSLFVRYWRNCFLGLYLVSKNTTSTAELKQLHCARSARKCWASYPCRLLYYERVAQPYILRQVGERIAVPSSSYCARSAQKCWASTCRRMLLWRAYIDFWNR